MEFHTPNPGPAVRPGDRMCQLLASAGRCCLPSPRAGRGVFNRCRTSGKGEGKTEQDSTHGTIMTSWFGLNSKPLTLKLKDTPRSPSGVPNQDARVSGDNFSGWSRLAGGCCVPGVHAPHPEQPNPAFGLGQGQPLENVGPGVPDFLIFQEEPEIWIFIWTFPIWNVRNKFRMFWIQHGPNNTHLWARHGHGGPVCNLCCRSTLWFYRKETELFQRWGQDFPKVTQLVNSRAETGTPSQDCHPFYFPVDCTQEKATENSKQGWQTLGNQPNLAGRVALFIYLSIFCK